MRAGGRVRSSLQRVRGSVWPLSQAAVAAGLAYFVANTVLGQPQPIFAPVAALVGLAASVGGRGQRVVRMLAGLVVGVIVGEVLLTTLGPGGLQITIASGIAMLLISFWIYNPLPLLQAGVAAAIVIGMQSPQSGGMRIIEAVVGGGVALVFSQVLFTPSPVRLLTDASQAALTTVAEGLRASATALARGDTAGAAAAVERLRSGQGAVATLDETRTTSRGVARTTLRGRREADHVERLDQRSRGIDLVFASALLLSRSLQRLLQEQIATPSWLPGAVDALAGSAEALAEDPEGSDAARRARAARTPSEAEVREDPRITHVREQVALTVTDILAVAANDQRGAAIHS